MDNKEEKLAKQAEIIESEILIQENVDHIKEEEIKVEGKLFYYVKTILSGVLDQIMAFGIALVMYWVIDIILGFIGYRIDLRNEMFLMTYIISNVLYYPLIQEVFNGKTLGKKIMTR